MRSQTGHLRRSRTESGLLTQTVLIRYLLDHHSGDDVHPSTLQRKDTLPRRIATAGDRVVGEWHKAVPVASTGSDRFNTYLVRWRHGRGRHIICIFVEEMPF